MGPGLAHPYEALQRVDQPRGRAPGYTHGDRTPPELRHIWHPSSRASTSTTSTACSPRRNAPCATRCAPGSTSDSCRSSVSTTWRVAFPNSWFPRWPSSACSAPICRRSTAAPGSTTWPTGSSCTPESPRSFASVQGALVMYPIYAFGSEEQKRRWLPPMAAGEVIGCFGLTEPDYGSNPGGMITVAKETKDGWVLNGAKMWITNGSTAQAAIVWAKTGTLDDVTSIRGFILPTR